MTTLFDRLPPLGGEGKRLRSWRDLPVDLGHLLEGKLDPRGFVSGFCRVKNPVEATLHGRAELRKMGCELHEVRNEAGEVTRAYWTHPTNTKTVQDAAGRAIVVPAPDEPIDIHDARWNPARKQIRRSHNLRVTMGRDNWQRLLMVGDIAANSTAYTGVTGTATSAPTSTTLTNSGAAFPTSGGVNGSLQGHRVYCPAAGVYGTIVSNTGQVLTVDQWTSQSSATGAAGTTPSNGAAYAITPGAGPCNWIGISTSSAAAAAGDVLRTADGLFADGTTSAAATEQSTNGLSRMFVQPTLISGGWQFAPSWTYTGSSLIQLYKLVLCNTIPVAGSLLFLETLLSGQLTPSGSGDVASATWQATL